MHSVPLPRSFVSLAASGALWSPETHAAHPPAFREAARTLLLVNECRGFGPAPARGEGGAGVRTRSGRRRRGGPKGVQLPLDLLQRILGLAGRPLLGWVPQLEGRVKAMEAAEQEVERLV